MNINRVSWSGSSKLAHIAEAIPALVFGTRDDKKSTTTKATIRVCSVISISIPQLVLTWWA